MKSLQHLVYATLLGLFLCSIAFPESRQLELEAVDEQDEDVADNVLRPRSIYGGNRAPASAEEGASEESWKYDRGFLDKFSFGLFVTEDLEIRRSSGEDEVSGAESKPVALPLVSLRTGYAFNKYFSVFAMGAVSFANGLRDPSLGIAARFGLTDEISAIATLTGTAPVSSDSQSLNKLTTITVALSPIYQYRGLFLGVHGFVSFHAYRGTSSSNNEGNRSAVNVDDSDLQAGTVGLLEESITGGGTMYVGYELTRQLSANMAFGASNAYLSDSSYYWTSEATLVRLTLQHKGFAGSAGFAFVSTAADKDAVSIPSQPMVGLRVQYTFGSEASYGINRTESLPYARQ